MSAFKSSDRGPPSAARSSAKIDMSLVHTKRNAKSQAPDSSQFRSTSPKHRLGHMAKVKFIGTMGSAGILCLDEQTADSKGAKVNITNKKPGVILVVEDEFLIRLDAVDMIREAGFDA